MTSLQGHLLVAAPKLVDPDLAKTVVLLIQHSPQQAFGVVVNRPRDATVKELWQQEFNKTCECDRPINAGGPVPGPIMAVHECDTLAEIDVLPGVYYSIKKKDLQKLVRQSDCPLKIFDSHSGWGPGQLEGQLADDFSGRKWELTVTTATEARDSAQQNRDAKKARQRAEKEDDYRRRLLVAVKQFPAGETEKVLRVAAGLNGDNFGIAIRFLLQEGRVETCQIRKGKRDYDGYRRTKNS